jgi:predicted AAA+ superfamily ATPase
MKPMGGGIHRQAMDYFRQYMIVGGMPQVVKQYVQTRDFKRVDEEKRAILDLYRKDISNYADRQEGKVTAIFDEIPGQLQRHERRFRLAALKENARMRDYQDAFFWLSDARIINCCYNTTQPNIGLRLNEERATLKCYMADTGLLISHAFDENGIMKQDIYQKLMMDKLEVNAGMLVENMVAQMLRASGHKLYFYSRNSSETGERMEIDFLIAKSKITTRHNISPIEVKSSTNYTLTSLNKFTKKFANYLSTSYVVHGADLEIKENTVYLPLYMVPLL